MTPDAIIQQVRRAQSKDHEAFTPLVEWFHPTVYGLAYSMVRDRATAEDIAQDALLVAWEHLPNLGQPGAFAGWLRQITRNLALGYLRSERYRNALAERHDFLAQQRLWEEPPEVAASQTEARACVHEALEVLSPKVRDVVLLYYLHDASVEETARALEVSPTTVRQRLRRGRETLRGAFENRWEQAFDEVLRDFTPTKVLRRFVAGLALGCVLPSLARAAADPATVVAHRRNFEGGRFESIARGSRWAAGAIAAVLLLMAAGWLVTGQLRGGGDTGRPGNHQHAAQAVATPVPSVALTESVPSPPPAEEGPRTEGEAVEPAIRGTVRNEEGDPIPGAVVTAYTGVYDPVDTSCRFCLESSVRDAPFFTTQTEADGTYTITGIIADEPVLVTAREDRYCWTFRERVSLSAEGVDFVLSPANLFEGVVVDAVTGAAIPEFEARITTINPGGFYSIARTDVPWELFQSPDGRFQLHTDAYVDVQIAVRARGYIEARGPFYDLRGGFTSEVIALQPGETLSGYALDGVTGAPVAGALVGIGRDLVEAENFARQNWGQTTAMSDAEGRFVLSGVDFEDDHAFIISWHRDYAPAFSPLPADRSGEVELAFFAPARIRGVVLMNGQPLELVRPKVRYWLDSRHRRYQSVYTTAEDGYFEFNNLPPGEHSILYTSPRKNGSYGVETVSVAPGEEVYIERDFADIGGIRFEVVGYEAYEDPWLLLFPPGEPGHELRSIKLVERPALTLPMITPGTYRLQVIDGDDVLYEEDITTEDGMLEERLIDITPVGEVFDDVPVEEGESTLGE